MTANRPFVRFRGWRLIVVLAIAGVGLSGCSSLVPGADRDPPRLYDLSPKNTFSKKLPRARWQLVVELPVAAAGLSSARIALKRHHLRLEYFARTAWTDTTPKMIQTLIIESFENSNRIVSVGRTSTGLRSDYVLQTGLREFQAEYTKGKPEDQGSKTGPKVRISLTAKLVMMPERTIIASRTIKYVRFAKNNDMESIVLAFDEALGKTLKRLVEWSIIEGQRGWYRRRQAQRRSLSMRRR